MESTERLGPQEVTPSPGHHFSGGQVQLETCILEGRGKRRFIYLCSHCQFQKRTKNEAECHENTQNKLGENGKAGFPRRRRRVRRWRRKRSQAPAKLSHRQKGCIKNANPLLRSGTNPEGRGGLELGTVPGSLRDSAFPSARWK